MATTTTSLSSSSSPVLQSFDTFRADLDDYNDRRERLIKASRDITNLSKKAIFLLHRLVQNPADANEDQPTHYKKAAQQGYEKLREIQDLYAKLQPELEGDKYWRYQRQVSPGLQEYIEALSFAHYLDHGTLITFDEVQKTLMTADGVKFFPLTVSDYLLGLSDLTGELMRFAISGIANKGGRQKASEVCAFVRRCKADFEGLTPYIRDLRKKQSVTTQSLEKIEDAAYAIFVRSSEYDLPPEILDDIVAQSVSNYSSHTYETRGHRRDLHAGSDDENGAI
ncbi:Translin-associated protein X [Psilocybe cubensis]|uniref:Translin-associated protein X n=2 Tax=Psilocybe cubensis TaxID=181762 RepID=A0ACB8HH05_PSICU|nr:Translin-associated protein X [Psilocybe cubensis]KAH9487108.1 Translin-associated protein X [Psilocybe cubensis]